MATRKMTPVVRRAHIELITAALWYRLTKVKEEYGNGRGYLKEFQPFANFLTHKDTRGVGARLMDIYGTSHYPRLGHGFPSRAELESILRTVRSELQHRCDEHGYSVNVSLELRLDLEERLCSHVTMDFTIKRSRRKAA